MSGAIMDALKTVADPINTYVVDKIKGYLHFINTYDVNMRSLHKELSALCAKKLDIDERVKEGRDMLRVMTRETANWLRSVQDLIEREEMKTLMRKDEVAEIVVKMMEQRILKKLLDDDREVFDIVVNVLNEKCHKEGGDGEGKEVDDYKKVAKLVIDVMKDTVAEFKELIKEDDDMALAAVKLLKHEHLEKLMEDDADMTKILRKAEEISRKEFEQKPDDKEDDPLLKKDEEEMKVLVNTSVIITEKVENWGKRMESLRIFQNDVTLKNSVPEDVQSKLGVAQAARNKQGIDQKVENTKLHRYCGWSIDFFQGHRDKHDFSESAETMIEEIKSRKLECPKERVTRTQRAEELDPIPNDYMEGLQSREDVLKKIIDALKDEHVTAVGVFGMGGIGKTTLAKELANKRVEDLFSHRVVVEVSETPNVIGIQDQIAKAINLPLDDAQTMAQRALRLYNGLKSDSSRKILIILDNIWKKLKLNVVGIPLASTGDFCCKILLTTRNRQVCRDMAVDESNTYEVGMLNTQESRDLFGNLVGEKVKNEGYKAVAERLLRKCGGLPLAIVVAGSALKGKKLPKWRHFADESEKSISSKMSTEYHEAYSILETSYNLIESQVKKTFFFLVCLSSVDGNVSIEDLMRYGIGLNLFQHVNKLFEAMEQANDWAKELISSSLLLKGDLKGHLKIHEVVRASAILFAEKGKDNMLVESIPRWMCEETFKSFTSISLLSGNSFSPLRGVKAYKLQTLLLKGDVLSQPPDSNFFQGMVNLKILSLLDMSFKAGLPNSIRKLKGLRTLHLHHCELREIQLIGKLANLLVLSFRGSTLELDLPEDIGELCKLRLLDMSGCKGEFSIPADLLSRLIHLEGFYAFDSFNDWAARSMEASDNAEPSNRARARASTIELTGLDHLNVLEMHVPKLEQLVNDDAFVDRLNKSKMCVGDLKQEDVKQVLSFHHVLTLSNIEVFLERKLRNNCLKALLQNAESLHLQDSSRFGNLVPQLDEEGFKNLKNLEVTRCKDIELFISSNVQEELPMLVNLESLNLNDLKNLEKICDLKMRAGMLSNLQHLRISQTPKLKYVLSTDAVVPLNLVDITTSHCSSLECIVIENEFQCSDGIGFPYLKSIDLSYSENLQSVSGLVDSETDAVSAMPIFFNGKNMFPSLVNLSFFQTGKFARLWSEESHTCGFRNLRSISVWGCAGMLSVGPPSIFAALVHLEELKLSSCSEMREVISKETEENEIRERIIIFPHLKILEIKFNELECFYRGSYRLEFPNLRVLDLSRVKRMSKFVMSQNTALFSDEIEFPSLIVQEVAEEVEGLWNWNRNPTNGNNGRPLNPVPKLRSLNIGISQGLRSIPQSVCNNLSSLQVTAMGDIKTMLAKSVTNQEVFCTYGQFPKLEHLYLQWFHVLENLVENEEDEDAVEFCGQLTQISLDFMFSLNVIPLHLFKNLRSVAIASVVWEYFFSADLLTKGLGLLEKLETLNVWGCSNMKAVIQDDGINRSYFFRCLKTLTLRSVYFTSFCSRPSATLHFPLLESVSVSACSQLQSFCQGPFIAPKLQRLVLEDCHNLRCFLPEDDAVQQFPNLESVKIILCQEILSFSFRPITTPKLRELALKKCPIMQRVVAGGNLNQHDGGVLELPSLESLSVDECPCILSFSEGPIEAPKFSDLNINGQYYFKLTNKELINMLGNLSNYCNRNLSHLQVFGNQAIKIVVSASPPNKDVFCPYDHFAKLEHLHVNNCSMLEELIENEEDEDAINFCQQLSGLELTANYKLNIVPLHLFKNLRSLSIDRLSWEFLFSADLLTKCRELLEKLENLRVCSCENMKAVIEDDGNDRIIVFPCLKTLYLIGLKNTSVCSRPSASLQFPSLESMTLSQCSKLQSFCQGPFIAQKLKNIKLLYCDDLQCFLPEDDTTQQFPNLERVEIDRCQDMVSFSSRLITAPKLQSVTTKWCPKMQRVIAKGNLKQHGGDVLELPSLKKMSIENCPGLLSFSEGPIRAPNFDELLIGDKYYLSCTEELVNMLDNLHNYCKSNEAEEKEEIIEEL